MVDALLHLGIEHADLTGPVLWAAAAFVAGVGVGRYVDRLSAAVRELTTEPAE